MAVAIQENNSHPEFISGSTIRDAQNLFSMTKTGWPRRQEASRHDDFGSLTRMHRTCFKPYPHNNTIHNRGHSSVGRVLGWQPRGRGFEAP